MIKYYYKSIRHERMQELKDVKRGTWIYVEAPSERELEALAEKFSLELGHLKDAIDEDEMPRLEKEGTHSYIFIRFAYKPTSVLYSENSSENRVDNKAAVTAGWRGKVTSRKLTTRASHGRARKKAEP